MTVIERGELDPRTLAFAGGPVVVKQWKNLVVAQSRPGLPVRGWTALQRHWRIRFGLAAKMAASPVQLDYMTAFEMAKGTEQVPRDILTAAALGRYYILTNEDGTEWQPIAAPYKE